MEKKLLKNWVLPKLKQIVKYQKGKKPKILKEEEFDGSVPYLDIKAFEKDEVRRYADIESSTLIQRDEIGIVWDGARSGWVSKNKAGAVGSTIAVLKPIAVNPELVYRFLESKFDYLNTNTRGIGIPHVDPNVLWDIDFPLPPLPEQTRIVAKLDKLFDQLEQIKESLDKIPQLLKDFRQQVLTQAVSGKLTAEWREVNHLENWRYESATQCCEKVQSGGTPKGGNFSIAGIPFFKVYNIVNQKIDFDYKPQYVTEEIQNTQCKKSICYPNDVLMNIVGPPLNKVAIIPERFTECNINQAITVFRPKPYLNNKFLYYYLREGTPVNRLVNETRGVVGQVNISLTQCREFSIPIPHTLEQQEIVRRIEALLDKSDLIEQQYQSLKNKIDTLPQAILHKAFKGELVPQLESDGDAQELLEEIKALKKQTAKPNVRMSPSASLGQATVEPLKKPKAYRVEEVELDKVAEEIVNYSKN